MTAPLLDSLSLKIRSFLQTADVAAEHMDDLSPSAIKALEKEDDLSLMRFLEHEWIQEQVHRDFESGVFSPLKRA